MKAMIFDIKRCSQNDGQGIRTTVFFKGCNLDCFWCHNPEGKVFQKQYALFQDKCRHCGICENLTDKCFEETVCSCPSGARRVYGQEYKLKELLDIILLDKEYYLATGGGVTFSGGECMLQIDFVTELARLCRENGISTAIDTAGCVPYTYFEKVLPYTDIFLYDIKCLDSDLHRKGTKQDNALILENLESGARSEIKIKEKAKDGRTLKFQREKTVNEESGKIIYREIVEFTLYDNNFSGSDKFIVEKYDKNNSLIEKSEAKYIVAGVKLSGNTP